ncbi:hypothetical protein GPALN_011632 [Globodera pallida]|nr:hypothetical protein GPALN_011632 [Globodera pallida]
MSPSPLFARGRRQLVEELKLHLIDQHIWNSLLNQFSISLIEKNLKQKPDNKSSAIECRRKKNIGGFRMRNNLLQLLCKYQIKIFKEKGIKKFFIFDYPITFSFLLKFLHRKNRLK